MTMPTIQSQIFTAVNNNKVETLEKLLDTYIAEGGEIYTDWINRAAKRNFVRIADLLRQKGCAWDTNFTAISALHGSLDCLMYGYEHGCPWDETCTIMAAKHGSVECLAFAHERGCPWNEECCSMAAKEGSLDCLIYAHENGCPWDSQTCTEAAGEDEFECLRYAHENGCPWDATTTAAAATGFNTDILSYCHLNGCPWDETTVISAIDDNNQTTLEYALQNACPVSMESAYRASDVQFDLFTEVVNVLSRETNSLQRGLSFAEEQDRLEQSLAEASPSCDLSWYLASQGNVECLAYILSRGWPLHPGAGVAAATNDQFEMWMYLWENCENPQKFVDQDYHGTLIKFIHRINPKYDVWSKLLQVDCSVNQELEQFIRQYKRDQWDY